MHISSRLTDSEYAAGHALDAVRGRANTAFDDCLHLAVSTRSFRAENVSSFVKCVLDHETRMAAEAYERLKERYPIVVTRDRQRYQLNAYRVLLTRARQGMVIFVPPGEKSDPTRPPEFYDATEYGGRGRSFVPRSSTPMGRPPYDFVDRYF